MKFVCEKCVIILHRWVKCLVCLVIVHTSRHEIREYRCVYQSSGWSKYINTEGPSAKIRIHKRSTLSLWIHFYPASFVWAQNKIKTRLNLTQTISTCVQHDGAKFTWKLGSVCNCGFGLPWVFTLQDLWTWGFSNFVWRPSKWFWFTMILHRDFHGQFLPE